MMMTLAMMTLTTMLIDDIENDDDIESNKENTANIVENNLKIVLCFILDSLLFPMHTLTLNPNEGAN